MTDHVDNRIEFGAQTAATRAVARWLDNTPPARLIGCTPAMVAQVATDAYRRSRDAACIITTVAQLDALPDGAVIRSGDQSYESAGAPYWLEPGSEIPRTSDGLTLPALLLWHPDWTGAPQ